MSEYQHRAGWIVEVDKKSGKVYMELDAMGTINMHTAGIIGSATDVPHAGDRIVVSLKDDLPVAAKLVKPLGSRTARDSAPAS